MSGRLRRNPVAVALYVNAALLLAILVVLAGRDRTISLTPQAFGQAQPTIAGGAGLFMVPAQFSSNIWGVYLMDVDQQTICAYTVTGSPPTLKLAAARSFRNDRRLGNYNTANPSPAEVKDLVEKEQAGNRVNDRPATPAPSPEK
jgi:hypothetical protein